MVVGSINKKQLVTCQSITCQSSCQLTRPAAPAQASRASRPALRTSPPTAAHLRTIIHLVPQDLKPHVAMMMPALLDPSQHTVAAGILLSALADAAASGPECEAELQLPVCTALGMLHIEPSVADATRVQVSPSSRKQADLWVL